MNGCKIFQPLIYAGITCLLLTACSRQEQAVVGAEADEEGVLQVYTVNYPLQYFAGRIGGSMVEVHFPSPEEGDPAFWSPSAEVISAYQQADLILLNGADYAKWVPKVTLPPSVLVDTGKAIRDHYLPLKEEVTHTHGPGGAHEHGGVAFTTWLDPQLAVEQARAVAQALGAKRPAHKARFEQHLAELEADLLELDARLSSLTAGLEAKPLLFSHPVYQYFQKRYGLNGRSLHWEPDEIPDETMWNELQALLREHPARWMIWEGEPLPEITERLNGMGIQAVVFEPCGNRPGETDYLKIMRQNLDRLQAVNSAE